MKRLTLNQKEQARLQVVNEVLEGGVRVREAARAAGLSFSKEVLRQLAYVDTG